MSSAPALSDLERTPTALTIAGCDSGGGAGIAADLKAFARCGVHGMAAVTAITAQNTLGVEAIELTSPQMIVAQVQAVAGDIGVDAVKVGMLGSAETVRTVADILARLPAGTPVVVDPVMVSESGATLLAEDAIAAMLESLLPAATVLTPNLIEAKALLAHAKGAGSRGAGADLRGGAAESRGAESSGAGADSRARAANSMGAGAEARGKDPDPRREHAVAGRSGVSFDGDAALLPALLELGPKAVVLTGGHRTQAGAAGDRSVDLLMRRDGGGEVVEIAGPRHASQAAHGSGCTHSAALAAALALGHDLEGAARLARAIAGAAVRDGLSDIGGGPGPVDVIGLRTAREAVRPHGDAARAQEEVAR